MSSSNTVVQHQLMRNYYKFQSGIYDATRWSFLFGRKKILDFISFETTPGHIVEVGCGTGHNLKILSKYFPETEITGIDVSADMLSISRKKFLKDPQINLIEQAYGNQSGTFSLAPDLILFSYTLTMINPQWSQIIEQAYQDLAVGGKIAVVDFHSSKVSWFKKHMRNHHVRMDAHMDQLLNDKFKSLKYEVRSAYGGLWNYFYFIGEKQT